MDFQSRLDAYGEKLKREAHEFNKSRFEKQDKPEMASPVDYYEKASSKLREESKSIHPRGASTLTKQIAKEELEKLSKFKKRAEDDAEYWKERGDNDRASMVKDQYIEERFLPAIEMVVIASTPDEVLNSKDILKEFDDLSMQYGPGYTESYIRTAYGDQLGNASSRSDGYVVENVERVKYLAAMDQIRAAYGLAKKIKGEIDNGDHTASEDDYEILARVASFE